MVTECRGRRWQRKGSNQEAALDGEASMHPLKLSAPSIVADQEPLAHTNRRWFRQPDDVDKTTIREQPSSHQQQRDYLMLRAAQDAQDSARRVGMEAQIENSSVGDLKTIVLGGEANYLPGWLCAENDRSMFDLLMRELQKHIRPFRGKSLGLAGTQEILDECPTYKHVVTRLAQHFHVEPCYSIVNLYRKGSDGIGAHTDSMQFGANMTIGASFGDSRELVFEHKVSQQRFEFPQRNGDVFAFTDVANRAFRHSVPKTKEKVGSRLSVIVWARQGGYKPVFLHTPVMPSEQEILEAGGDWNRAQKLAQDKTLKDEISVARRPT